MNSETYYYIGRHKEREEGFRRREEEQEKKCSRLKEGLRQQREKISRLEETNTRLVTVLTELLHIHNQMPIEMALDALDQAGGGRKEERPLYP